MGVSTAVESVGSVGVGVGSTGVGSGVGVGVGVGVGSTGVGSGVGVGVGVGVGSTGVGSGVGVGVGVGVGSTGVGSGVGVGVGSTGVGVGVGSTGVVTGADPAHFPPAQAVTSFPAVSLMHCPDGSDPYFQCKNPACHPKSLKAFSAQVPKSAGATYPDPASVDRTGLAITIF
jgi:hypothetical protein